MGRIQEQVRRVRVGNNRGLGIAEYLRSNLEKTVSDLARSSGPMEVPAEGGHAGLHWCQFTGYVVSSTGAEGARLVQLLQAHGFAGGRRTKTTTE